ncbi:CPBP family intramembrane metalloprotease [Clostridium sp. MCC353]|uniref:CPBP family intramembrane glutamic endopeptidase n=1 Tax=Clostridium sp. MCC353 TaxID=2592646 RepID=UPI001C00D257|nr:type II CAAX endopeptidase family protein [Clostridium sp. MCC353]MBT9778036.1 CPBP family intramembrane metalloprotease [Clostridium sp. MCC353]
MRNSLVDLEHDRRGLKTIFHVLMGIVIWFAGNILASLPVDLFFSIVKMEPSILAVVAIRALLTIIVLISLTIFYILKILKLPLHDFRIRKPKNIITWFLCAVVLPVAVSSFFILFTPGIFHVSELNNEQIIEIIWNAIFRTCLVAGITEELIFRGLIMHILELRWGKAIAVLAPSVLFGLLHIFNMKAPNAIDILILVIAGTAVGIMFSLITIQSSSIWSSAVVHGIWNLVIIGGILEISVNPRSAIFTYALKSKSYLLTGGAFGIESSLPAIIGYSVVILIIFTLNKNNPPTNS